MKKLLYLFWAFLLALTSCSGDDDNSASLILPKKIIYTFEGRSSEVKYIYNGNKIVSMIGGNGYKMIYTYTGDLITKVEETDNGTVTSTTDYVYTNGKLFTKITMFTGDSVKFKMEYTHNTDGTISFEGFVVNVITGVVQQRYYGGVYTFKDGNLIKEENESGSTALFMYEYDTKNNPFKNILGFDLLLGNYIAVNNRVKDIYYDSMVTYTYTYDENGFPTEQKRFYDGKDDGSSTFIY